MEARRVAKSQLQVAKERFQLLQVVNLALRRHIAVEAAVAVAVAARRVAEVTLRHRIVVVEEAHLRSEVVARAHPLLVEETRVADSV